MGQKFTLDFNDVAGIHNPERARYLLSLLSAAEVDALIATKVAAVDAKLAGKQDQLGFAPVNKAGDTMTGRLTVSGVNSAAGDAEIVVKGDGDGGFGTYGALEWQDKAAVKMGLLTNPSNVGGDWGMFVLLGSSGGARLGEWDIAARDLSGEKRVGGLTGDPNPNSDGGYGVHVFTREASGSLNYALWLDGNHGVAIGNGFAGGFTPPTNGLIVEGSLGIGVDAPGYSLDVAGDAHMSGNVSVDGKVTALGGFDPPYVLYDAQTRDGIVARVSAEVPPEKRNGGVLFFNNSTHRLEIYVPSEGVFYDMAGLPILGAPVAVPAPAEYVTRHYFDSTTGEVKAQQIVASAKYAIRDGFYLDAASGTFYKIEKGEVDPLLGTASHTKVGATKEEAVIPIK